METLKRLLLGMIISWSAIKGYAATSLNSNTTTAVSNHVAATVTVYKSRTCSCCLKWINHLKDNGFTVISHDVDDLALYKEKANLPKAMRSCHTAFVDKYAVEGHVPAEDIRRMLKEQPDIRGIAVPNMPIGSPGMEQKGRHMPYQTISYTLEGKTTIYASH